MIARQILGASQNPFESIADGPSRLREAFDFLEHDHPFRHVPTLEHKDWLKVESSMNEGVIT